MKIRIILYSIIVVIIVLVQSTVLNYLNIHAVKPNLVLVFTILIALIKGINYGATLGLVCGLMQDIISGRIMGIYAVIGLYTGVVVGLINKRLYKWNLAVSTAIVFLFTGLYELVICILLVYNLDEGISKIFYSIWDVIVPEAFYNSIVSSLIYFPIIKLEKHLEERLDKATSRF